jgi:hypothetical protein
VQQVRCGSHPVGGRGRSIHPSQLSAARTPARAWHCLLALNGLVIDGHRRRPHDEGSWSLAGVFATAVATTTTTAAAACLRTAWGLRQRAPSRPSMHAQPLVLLLLLLLHGPGRQAS